MNRQAGPSIVLSFLIVAFFAVVLFPRDSARTTASTPRNPIAGPILAGRPGSKPAEPNTPRPEPIARYSADTVDNPPSSPKTAANSSNEKVASTNIAGTIKNPPPNATPADSSRRIAAIPERPVAKAPAMGRTESRSPRPVSAARRVDPSRPAVKVASKESIRPDPQTWSLVHPKESEERPPSDR